MSVLRMAIVYKDEDIDMSILEGKTVSVIGYGSQGRAQALNMKDSGVNVLVGVRTDGPSWNKAKTDGLEARTVEDAAKQGDVVHLLIPDQTQPEVYESQIRSNLREGAALGFSHAFNIHFGQIAPPATIDVVMVAPKAPGAAVRDAYLKRYGVPGLFAVAQDHSGSARKVALALGKAVGLARVGMLETTFKEEVESDLFGEQAVLCGGVTELIKAGFDTLVEAGYQPELAYYECLNELKLIVDLIWSKGIEGMWVSVSNTAEYGGRTRGSKIITEQTRKAMSEMLEEIRTGRFAREWIMESKMNLPVLKAYRRTASEQLIEKVGKDLRKIAGLEK